MTTPLISGAALQGLLDGPDLRIVDATWRLDGSRPAQDAPRLPGALRFDLDQVADRTSTLPHMLPSPQDFARAVGDMGIAETDHVVVYDEAGMAAAARVWWTFRIMGAARVQVLDGGLPLWRAQGRPVTFEAPDDRPAARFAPRFDAVQVVDAARVTAALGDPDWRILDARSAARFRGEADEPRPGLRRGSMPGALNLPFQDVLGPDGSMKPQAELKILFDRAGLGPDHRVITTCGSGVTAALLALALAVAGRDSAVYDGSWAEWGALDGAPVVTGGPHRR